jgi:hypothetical protein
MAQSYNGWPASDDKASIGVVSSDVFPGGAKAGDVTTVLGYVARQLDARVEPCIDGWNWGYSFKTNANNPSQLSCHASGTAIDWNAPDHPNGSSGTFTDAQVGVIYQILAEVEGAVSWLQSYDEMHFEICVDAGTLAGVADRVGGAPPTPTPPTTPEGPFMALSDAEQNELLDGVRWLKNELVNGRAPGQKSLGTTVAAILPQTQENENRIAGVANSVAAVADDVEAVADDLTKNLFGPGKGQGQTTVGGTIAATLAQTQANAS